MVRLNIWTPLPFIYIERKIMFHNKRYAFHGKEFSNLICLDDILNLDKENWSWTIVQRLGQKYSVYKRIFLVWADPQTLGFSL